MSGLYKWMVPAGDGRPAPHNIMTGQWEPSKEDADQGIAEGFGAVSALRYGASQCGMAQHPQANGREEMFTTLLSTFNASDESWKGSDSI